MGVVPGDGIVEKLEGRLQLFSEQQITCVVPGWGSGFDALVHIDASFTTHASRSVGTGAPV